MRKLRIGLFSFTGCEGSTIMFTEILNRYYREWFAKLEFVHARTLRRDDTKDIQQMDVAFVEGAISSASQEAKLKEIRAKAAILVAIGSCAVNGSPSNQRNFFNESQKSEIRPILDAFPYSETVRKLADIVPVDANVPGCPMNEQIFIDLVNKSIAGLGEDTAVKP